MALLAPPPSALAMVPAPPPPITAAALLPVHPLDWHGAFEAAGRARIQGYPLMRACLDAAEAAEAQGDQPLAAQLLLLASGAIHQHEERIAASAAV